MMGGGGGGGGGGAWGAIAGAVGDVLGSYMTGRFNKKEAAKQRLFAKNMYRRRYQYTMEDMRKAGLNPLLAGEVGAGTPPQGVAAQAGPGSSIGSATARNVMEAMNLRATIANTNANTAWTAEKELTEKANQDEARERANLAGAQAAEIIRRLPGVSDKIMEEINNLRANTAREAAEAANRKADLPRIEFEAGAGGAMGRILDTAGKLVPGGDALIRAMKFPTGAKGATTRGPRLRR